MWTIFFTKKTDLNYIIPLLDDWKNIVFSLQEKKIKEYFATKVVVYFDNKMIFHAKKGLHNNLLESLSAAEQEMQNAFLIFKPVKMYLIKEDKGYCLLVSDLQDKEMLNFNSDFNDIFKEISTDLGSLEKLEKLEFSSWSTIIFNFELVNFAQNWINYTPDLEQRSKLQAEHILFNMTFRKSETSLVEKVNFDNNISNHPQYSELLEKVLKVMPKIESSLEQEWRTKIVNIKKERKTKAGI